ncbi:MAG: glycerate kinase [Mariprofundaceae bacterium]
MPKRILLAPDAYKGCLGADAVARAMGEGVRRILPEAKLRAMPMADGGEGSLDILLAARRGERHVIELPGPDGSPLRVAWGLLSGPDGQAQAVIEVAQVVGLPLAGDAPVERRGSQGVGMLMRHCLDRGVRYFIVCLGGSGSNDGGAGLLAALGLRLLNAAGSDIRADLSGLADLARLDAGALDPRLFSCRIDMMRACATSPVCARHASAWR